MRIDIWKVEKVLKIGGSFVDRSFNYWVGGGGYGEIMHKREDFKGNIRLFLSIGRVGREYI